MQKVDSSFDALGSSEERRVHCTLHMFEAARAVVTALASRTVFAIKVSLVHFAVPVCESSEPQGALTAHGTYTPRGSRPLVACSWNATCARGGGASIRFLCANAVSPRNRPT